jgi:type II secretory pathway pseudopilin PulG
MKMNLRLRNCPITKLQNRSRGYVLITLMLFLSLLAIAALAVLPDIAFQVKRDREEELIHRGLAYSRGIRRYYRKFGRYPTKIEDLESANTLRFIRKRYKDPLTGGDFKIVRVGDAGLGAMFGAIPGQNLQNLQGAPGVTLPPQTTGPGANVGPGPGIAQQVQMVAGSSDAGNPPDAQTNASSGPASTASSSDTSSSLQQVFGGGPMLGVVSTRKDKTIREFCSKSHYKDWYFVYDPSTDRGGTLKSPWCPGLNMPGVGANPNQHVSGVSPNTGPQAVTPAPQTQPTPANPGAGMPPEQ